MYDWHQVYNSRDNLNHVLHILRRFDVTLRLFITCLQALARNVLAGLLSGFRVSDLCARSVFDLKDAVNLIQRETSCFDIEEPDDWKPCKVEDSEDDVEAPADVVNTCDTLLACCKCQECGLSLPTGVMETTMYTQSQFVIMAMEAPRFRERLELISEGYRNGIARKDKPCDKRSVNSAHPLLVDNVLT